MYVGIPIDQRNLGVYLKFVAQVEASTHVPLGMSSYGFCVSKQWPMIGPY